MATWYNERDAREALREHVVDGLIPHINGEIGPEVTFLFSGFGARSNEPVSGARAGFPTISLTLEQTGRQVPRGPTGGLTGRAHLVTWRLAGWLFGRGQRGQSLYDGFRRSVENYYNAGPCIGSGFSYAGMQSFQPVQRDGGIEYRLAANFHMMQVAPGVAIITDETTGLPILTEGPRPVTLIDEETADVADDVS